MIRRTDRTLSIKVVWIAPIVEVIVEHIGFVSIALPHCSAQHFGAQMIIDKNVIKCTHLSIKNIAISVSAFDIDVASLLNEPNRVFLSVFEDNKAKFATRSAECSFFQLRTKEITYMRLNHP